MHGFNQISFSPFKNIDWENMSQNSDSRNSDRRHPSATGSYLYDRILRFAGLNAISLPKSPTEDTETLNGDAGSKSQNEKTRK